MAGHNIQEGLEFMNPFAQNETTFEATLRAYFPTITDTAVEYISQTLYPPVFDGSAGYTNYLARAYNNTVFNYIFSVPPSLHGDDVYYTSYNGPSSLVKNDTLAVIMQKYFTNFAMTDNPNAAGLPAFPTYGTGATVQNLSLTSIGAMVDNVANEWCLWWQKGLYA